MPPGARRSSWADRVVSAASANRWLRLQWLGIAILPAAYYLFSLAILSTTNYRIQRRQRIALLGVVISLASAGAAIFTRDPPDRLRERP